MRRGLGPVRHADREETGRVRIGQSRGVAWGRAVRRWHGLACHAVGMGSGRLDQVWLVARGWLSLARLGLSCARQAAATTGRLRWHSPS
jgi:hypothetical protein